MSPFTWPVEGRQLLLKGFIEQFVPAMAQKHKQFGSPYPLHDLFFLLGKYDGRQRTSPSNEQGHQKASFWSSVCCDASQLFPDTIGVPLLIDRFRSQT